MNKFDRFISEVKNGIKRKISSRRLKMQVSIEEFSLLSKKYFDGLILILNKVIKIISYLS